MEASLRARLPQGKFIGVPYQRSQAMRSVKGSGNMTTEWRLRLAMVRAGIKGWKVRPSGVTGRPDFLFENSKLAIFTDGCFWHGCPKCYHTPIKSHQKYWTAKVERNRERDQVITRKLRRSGWRVLRLWEHELRLRPKRAINRILRALRPTTGIHRPRP